MRYLIALLSIILIGCNGAEGEKFASELEKRLNGEFKTYKYKFIENDGQSRGIVHYAFVMDCETDKCNLQGWIQGWTTGVTPEVAYRSEVKATLLRNGEIFDGVLMGMSSCVQEIYDIQVDFNNGSVSMQNKRFTPGAYDKTFRSSEFTGGALDQWAHDYAVGCVDLH